MMRKVQREQVKSQISVIIAGIILILLFCCHQAVMQFSHDWLSVIKDQRLISIYWRTLRIAGVTTAMSVFFGLTLSYFLYETKLPKRSLFCNSYFWPLILPPYFLAAAWQSWIGDFGIIKSAGIMLNNENGCAFLLSLYLMPLVILTVGNSLQKLDAEQKEVALMLGDTRKYFELIWLRAALPGAFGGGLIVFVFSANNYSIPAILAINTLSTEIYAEFGAFYNYYHAFLKTVPILTLFLMVVLVFGKHLRSVISTEYPNKDCYPLTDNLILHVIGTVIWILYLAGAILLPVFGLLIQVKDCTNFFKAVEMAGGQIWFSFWFGMISALLITTIGLICAYVYLRAKIKMILPGLMFTLILPPIFAAIGLIFFLNRPWLNFIYNNGGLLFIGYVVRFLALIFVILLPAVNSIAKELEEASWLSGQSQWKTWYKIIFPLILPTFLLVWMVAFFFCYGEAETSILLYPPGLETISIRILSLLHYGANPIVNGLVLAQVLILGLTAFICNQLYRFIIIRYRKNKL